MFGGFDTFCSIFKKIIIVEKHLFFGHVNPIPCIVFIKVFPIIQTLNPKSLNLNMILMLSKLHMNLNSQNENSTWGSWEYLL